MKKLFAATLALGLLSGCEHLDAKREMERERAEMMERMERTSKEFTERMQRDIETQKQALAAQSKLAVDNIKSAAENNPVTTGLIVVGVLGALNNSDDKVTATATATATATSTSTSTSTATK